MQNNLPSFVVNLLNEKLSPFYCYHNAAHTLYVQEKAMEIGNYEGCSAEELELLSTAALWHDAGYIHTAVEHEEESCLLAQQYLPAFNYTASDISTICSIIRATRMPHAPQNKLQEIIADADLAYLGTTGAAEKAADLYRELEHFDPLFSIAAWNDVQIAFLIKHHYFTRYAKENFEPLKKEYLNRLLNGIE